MGPGDLPGILAGLTQLQDHVKNAPPPTVILPAALRWLQDLCMAEIIRRGPSQTYLDQMHAAGWSEADALKFWESAIVASYHEQRDPGAPPARWPQPEEPIYACETSPAGVTMEVAARG